MAKPFVEFLVGRESVQSRTVLAAWVVGGSLFVACCARFSLPLPFTPVPLTLANFGVLMVGLILGSRAGFAALALYLIEGVMGLPVFSPAGPGGLAQLFGPTGGFLLAYPWVAAVAGRIAESGKPTLARTTAAAILAEIVLFAAGISWLVILTHSLSQAVYFGVYGFVFAEVIKVMLAAALARHGRGVVRIRK
jgi:biotin transport system substrate-specific component